MLCTRFPRQDGALRKPDGEEESQSRCSRRCEWGHDDYSLDVENLPKAPPKPGQQELELA